MGILTAVLVFAAAAGATENNPVSQDQDQTNHISEHFKPLEFLIGKTWVGEFPGSDPDTPFVDVTRWEAILDGKVIRVSHSVNDGMYAGETLIVWNPEKEQIEYFYATNVGFYTRGTLSVEDGVIRCHEHVTGDDKITELKTEIRLFESGKYVITARYLIGGEWVDGHEATYVFRSVEE
jgi:hypothetical protein